MVSSQPQSTPHEEEEIGKIISEFCHVENPNRAEFSAYLDFYHRTTTPPPTPGFLVRIIDDAVSLSRSEIQGLATLLRASCHEPQSKVFACLRDEDRERVSRILVRVMFMIDCASRDEFPASHRIQHGEVFPVKWHADQSFLDFFHDTFAPCMSPGPPFRAAQAHVGLKAWKLEQRHGIRIVPTNDLVQHLLYDDKARTLSVFHQMAYLKAHIRHTAGLPLSASLAQSAKIGSLPPQLLLEVLFSVYHILLPLSTDKKSAKLAKRLVNRPDDHAKFDPALLIYDGLLREMPDDFEFLYLSRRLKILDHVVRNPRPANKFVSWIERHTSERNALTVAIIGLFLAVAVGLAQLAVSILAWRYPVSPPSRISIEEGADNLPGL